MEEQNNNECEKLKNEYLAGWQRAKADFLNYKKEEATRISELMDYFRAGQILEILKVVDNWDRAMKHTPEEIKDSDWLAGMEMIEGQLKNFLKSEGVQEIQTNGEKFNPEFHEAIEEEGNSSLESGAILEVLEKGYTLNNKLIRPAKVKIIK
ncbi:MAG: nucleotide exchange factor GrpE [bacterium]